jgi:hypothetical protein
MIPVLFRNGNAKIVTCLVFLSILLVTRTAAMGQSVGGEVDSLLGKWYIEGEDLKLLSKGAKIPAGKKIVPQLSHPDYYIYIKLEYPANTWKKCQMNDDCVIPEEGVIARYMKFIMDVILPRREKESKSVKGDGAQLTDNVVSLEGDLLDLSPVFKYAKAGRYPLMLNSLGGGSSEIITFNLTWAPDNPQSARVRLSKLKNGLYAIYILTQSGRPKGGPEDALVLICDATEYKQKDLIYQDILRLSHQAALNALSK